MNRDGHAIRSLKVITRATPEDLSRLVVAEGFHGIRGRDDPETILGWLVSWAEHPEAWVTVATVLDRRVVGYIVLGHPRKGFWAGADDRVLEVVFTEVSNPYRRHRVFDVMAEALAHDDRLEDSIVFARLMSQYWDQGRNRLRTWAYRQMMLRFTRALGFHRFATNDLAVALRPANVAVRRVGARVPSDAVHGFRAVARHDARLDERRAA